jgi:dTDP-4-amino-4,6-dideoxygalactose transaminase
MNVPFLDLKAQYRSIASDVQAGLQRVLDSCAFANGPEVAAFEQAFALFLQAEHCVGVNSGTSALHLALIAAGVGPGDEVITTAHTFVATAWAIAYVGATPVFVDIDSVTMTIDAAQVRRKLTAKTRCLLPVHLYGAAAALDELGEIARARGLALIEDAAQAHGARLHGKRLGTFGEFGCFSFYPGKNLGAYGEGGAVVTGDAGAADRLRRLRDHAQPKRYTHSELGFNMRMDSFQGAVLSAKLPHLDVWNAARRRVAARYAEGLAGLPGLRVPACREDSEPVWHLFVVRHPRRDDLQKRLGDKGIGTGLHYPIPVHLQPAFAHLGYKEGDLPHTEAAAAQCLTLPMFAEMTDEQVAYVIQSVREAVVELS